MPTCEVCGKREAVGVCSVAGVPYSAAYCKECLEVGAEPYNILVANTACAGGRMEDLHEAWHEIVNITLQHLNITREKFDADVEASVKEMEAYFAKENSKDEHGQ